MSIDQRLKEGLGAASSSGGEPSMDPLLHEVIVRGKRRRQIRRVVPAALVLILVVVGTAYAATLARDRRQRFPIAPPEASSGIVTTVVGNGLPRSSGDGGRAIDAAIAFPGALAFDAEGNLYVVEGRNVRRVRNVDLDGRISTVAGIRAPGPEGRHQRSVAGGLDILSEGAMAIDGHGNVFLGGGRNGSPVIVKVDRAGHVTRVAGIDEAGYSGDGGPATRAGFESIFDIAIDHGRLYIVDGDDARIRVVDERGIVRTIAGTGTPGYSGDGGPAVDAMIDATSICLDPQRGIVIAGGDTVRQIDPEGTITTVVGPSADLAVDTPEGEPRIERAEGIACDAEGNIYVVDSLRDQVFKIDMSGTVTLVAGTGGRGFGGDGGSASGATFDVLERIAIGPDGDLYVTDNMNDRVRRIDL